MLDVRRFRLYSRRQLGQYNGCCGACHLLVSVTSGSRTQQSCPRAHLDRNACRKIITSSFFQPKLIAKEKDCMQRLSLPYQKPRRRSYCDLPLLPTDPFNMCPNANMPQEQLYSSMPRLGPRRPGPPGRNGPYEPQPGANVHYSDEETEDEGSSQQGRRNPDGDRRPPNDDFGDRRGPREGVQVWWNMRPHRIPASAEHERKEHD